MGKTKVCRKCGISLNKQTRIPRELPYAKFQGRICHECYKKGKVEERRNQAVSVSLYIEKGNYPHAKIAQKLSKSGSKKWNLAKTFSTLPRYRIDPDTLKAIQYDSEFDEWKKGRDFLKSSLGSRFAREGYITKTDTRAGSYSYVFKGGKKIGTAYKHAVCAECGHDEIRIDHRGFKYCTECFVVQEALVHASISEYEPGLYEEPDVRDPVYQAWYKTINAEATGT